MMEQYLYYFISGVVGGFVAAAITQYISNKKITILDKKRKEYLTKYNKLKSSLKK